MRAIAAPASVFAPHLEEIREMLPSKFVMRLPSRILLGGPADNEFIQRLSVRVTESDLAPGVTVGLFSCDTDALTCLVGTFSVMSTESPAAQQEFNQHVAGAAPIQLTPEIRGYLLEKSTQQSPVAVSSIMWEQDGMFYKARFAAPERQNMLYMAVSMASNEPIYALNTALRKKPNLNFKIAPEAIFKAN